MAGIKILKRDMTVDLRNEILVRPEDRDRFRIAPSVHTYTIEGVRRTTMDRFLVYEFTSQRRLMDVVCITPHPYQVRYRQDSAPGGAGFNNVYTIVITGHANGQPGLRAIVVEDRFGASG